MKRRSSILTFLLLISIGVFAQNEDQFLPSELKQLTAVTEPATLRQGFFRIGTAWMHTGFKTIYDEQAKKVFTPGSTIARAQSFDFSVQYGITDRIQLNLGIPYQMDKVESSIRYDDPFFRSDMQVDFAEYGKGFGDFSAGLYTQIIKESDYMPALTVRITAEAPTGRKNPGNYSSDSLIFDSATGSGEFSLAVDILAKKIVYPYSFTFYTGIDYGFGGEKIFLAGEDPSPFKSAKIYYTAIGINFHLNDWICMTNDIYYTFIGREEINGVLNDDTKWRLMLMPHIHFQVKKLRLVQGVSIPLIGKMIPADPSYILVAQYIF